MGKTSRAPESAEPMGSVAEERASAPPPAMDDREELLEALSVILFEQRMIDFADNLDDDERTIFDRRLLQSRPEPIASLAEELGLSYRRTSSKVREIEERFREAVRDPSRDHLH
jgi:DNA-directed RNA polymerase sigma subunit (sigma70/sigma32)